MAVLLAVVMCWVGERTSLPEVESRGGPAVERSHTDTLPLGKLADSSAEGAGEAESADGSDKSDESDGDAVFVIAASLELGLGLAFRQYDGLHELNDWRVRSSISARGPPVV
jgi:hypothetical protein